MNQHIQIPSFKLNIVYVVAIAVVLFLSWTTIGQWKSNREINQANKELRKDNDNLLDDNKRKSSIIKDNEIITDRLTERVNSLLESDSIQKKELKTIKWRYAKLYKDYNNSSNDDKNQLFTDVINN